MPFVAVNVRGYEPPVPAAGVPDSTRVPASKTTPEGKAPVMLTVGAGYPAAVTVKLPAAPVVKVAPLAEVTDGA